MKIEIISMTLRNFKKVSMQEISFSHSTLVSGGNKVGKTTIYDAYLWCLFGITSKQNSVVQPLDAENNIIHHRTTSVTAVLKVDNEREITVQRVLKEKWKAKDGLEEQFCGTEQERLFNGVPLSVAAFNKKLSELVDCERWLLLSNVNNFFSKKISERREILMSLATGIDEDELMKPYPLVYQFAANGNKSIEEMLLQQKIAKKRAEDELKLIPAKVQAQETLRVDADFSSLRTEKKHIDRTLDILEKELQGVACSDPLMDAYLTKLQLLNQKSIAAEKMWHEAKISTIEELAAKKRTTFCALQQAQCAADENRKAYILEQEKIADLNETFDNLMNQWKEENEKQFEYRYSDTCPVCGRPYTDEMKAAGYENAVAEYNRTKANKLTKIQNNAAETKQRIIVLKGKINAYKAMTEEEDKQAVSDKQVQYEELQRLQTEAEDRKWEDSPERSALKSEYAALEEAKPKPKAVNASVAEKNKERERLLARQGEIISLLAAEQTNARIDEEKSKLSNQSVELSQTIADCDEAIRQIKVLPLNA